FVIAVLAGQAASTATVAQTGDYLRERCAQLIGYYDYYCVSRPIAGNDGVRNHTRISAAIDCERGSYEAGAKTMEALISRKHWPVPLPGIASTPDGEGKPIDADRIPRGRTSQTSSRGLSKSE